MRKATYGLLGGLLGASISVVGLTPASANVIDYFTIDPLPGGVKMYSGDGYSNVAWFTGTVGGQHSGPPVTVTTIGNIDTGAGFADIKPVKTGSLTELTFTPANPNLFNDFSFRGQLEKTGFNGVVDVTVQDNQGHAPETFDFTVPHANADFGSFGIVSNYLGETINWVSVYTDGNGQFKEFKQVEFSKAVPEPSTWAMMLLGFAGLGFAGYRRTRKRLPAVSAA